ncbi:MAG: transglycosylase domain-containing protein [Clostridia bacterium]|nr:transglycosylase domain-containing protein [Clostridia bacterium]MBR5428142.1 transglycosylase domain-containing protein [Clostridia bacterium]
MAEQFGNENQNGGAQISQPPVRQQNDGVRPGASAQHRPSAGGAVRPGVSAQRQGTASARPQPARTRSKKKKRKRKEHKILRWFFALIFLGILFAGLTGGLVGGYVLKYMESQVNGDMIIDLDLQTSRQSKTSIIYAYDNNGGLHELEKLHGVENRIWVSLDQIPYNLQKAYIALEDFRFYEHGGVDWIRTVGGVIKSKFKQGGSTITQQLIKNLTQQNDRTFSRKFYEIIQALNLEKYNSKDKILEAYLNTLYLDAGCYGVETAANYYFGKHVQDLDLAECSCLAAITKAPRAYNPLINFEDNNSRRRLCLDYMQEYGFITEAEMQAAKDEVLKFNVGENKVKVTSLNAVKEEEEDDEEFQSYYSDYVIEDVIADLMSKYNYTRSIAQRMVTQGGLSIYSAVDMDIQDTLEDIYVNRTSFPKDEAIQSAMTIMDYSGRIVAMVGGAGEKTGNRVLNMASSSPRQPGSAIKPLSVYAPAINEDLITWSSMVQNYGIMHINGKIWPHNYGGDPGSPGSYVTVQQALVPSYNTVPAQILKKLTIDTSIEYLQNAFHLTHLDEHDHDYSPLATGGMHYGVTTLEMAAAYATFGNMGRYYKPYSYYKVLDASGATILEHDPNAYEQAISPGTADVMNKLLQTVVTSSNGTARKFPIDGQILFAKTGTTTNNNDSWFCGGTPYYVGSVWFGYRDSNRELKNIAGNSPSGKVFKTVFDRIHEGLPEKNFEMSDESVEVSYCYSTGKRATSSCGWTGKGWYKADNIPGYCNGGGYENGGGSKTTTDPDAAETTGDSSAETTKTGDQSQTTSTTKPSETKPPETKPPETKPPETAPPPEDLDPDEER